MWAPSPGCISSSQFLTVTLLCSYYDQILCSYPGARSTAPRFPCALRTKLVMTSLRAAARLVLAVAVGCAHILQLLIDFVNGISPRSPVLDAAVAVVLVALPIAYLMGVVLVYLHVTTSAAAAAHRPGASRRLAAPLPGASSRLAAVACTVTSALLVALVVPLIALLSLAAGSPPAEWTPPT